MARYLVVDDERTFNFFGRVNVAHARTSSEAIEFLHSQPEWDAIFLDHDLGAEDDTTIPVVRFLKETENKSPVYVHSMNPVGSRNIMIELPDALPVGRWRGESFRIEVEGWDG